MPNNTLWNLESIKAGFERFLKENGRLPTAREIDKCGYLLTSRQIQRRFGGLETLRLNLNLSVTNYSKGENRSKIAKAVNIRGKEAEFELRKVLVDKFGEKFVHVERPLDVKLKTRLDFFVFSPSGDFAVDVFYPKDFDSMINSLNIKSKVYKGYNDILYLVVANDSLLQDKINLVLNNKRNILNKNIKVLNINYFLSEIKDMKVYREIVVGNGLN